MRLFPRKKKKKEEQNEKKEELGWCRWFCKLVGQSPGRSGRSESRAQRQQNLAHGKTLEIVPGVRNARNAWAGRLAPEGRGRGQNAGEPGLELERGWWQGEARTKAGRRREPWGRLVAADGIT